MQDLKQLLRDSAQREQALMQQVAELKETVAVLERFPADALTSDAELVRELQQMRSGWTIELYARNSRGRTLPKCCDELRFGRRCF